MAGLLSGCSSTSYYWQALSGQISLLQARDPVTEWLDDPATQPALRRQLVLSQRVVDFAQQEMRLPDNGSYRSYVAWPESHLVWNLVAAPELSLQPRQWCFLLLGCVAYRGYFSESAARDTAQQLTEQGWDVAVGGVAAYSTLGWFKDPLVSTMLHWGDDSLIELLLHELAHQKLYVKDDSGFNEAYASAVAEIGLRQWLLAHPDPGLQRAWTERRARQIGFADLVAGHRTDLEALYASPLDDAAKREGKAAVLAALKRDYAALKARWQGYAGYDAWIASVNNARLSLLATYQQKVPGFVALFAQQGDDWAAFHQAMARLAKLPPAERDRLLAEAAKAAD